MNFEQYLKSLGYEIIGITSTGEDAVKKAADLEVNLILMDIGLKGDMDGIEAAARIKDNINVPVVYLTACPEKSIIKRAKLTSPHGYVFKPVNKMELKKTIKMALYNHQMENNIT